MQLLHSKELAAAPVTAFYTGGSGTYASVSPDSATSAYIKACCDTARAFGYEGAIGPLDQHVTVIHSKASLNLDQQNAVWESGYFSAARRFRARPVEFTHWGGHNDKGYVVLELLSDDLFQVNYWLRDNFDLPVSFEDYRAHVTIVQDAYLKEGPHGAEKLIHILDKLPKPDEMIFTGLRIEDLKP